MCIFVREVEALTVGGQWTRAASKSRKGRK
jgi:hypothetical protein